MKHCWHIIQENTSWVINDDQRVKFWMDAWCFDSSLANLLDFHRILGSFLLWIIFSFIVLLLADFGLGCKILFIYVLTKRLVLLF